MNQFAAVIGILGAMSAAAPAQDLSKYRAFRFGTDLATVARQTGVNQSVAKVIHTRPALMQELAWRPQPFGASTQSETAQDVVFSFYDGQLYRIAISYDRRQTEGMTPGDLIDAISVMYGVSTKPAPASDEAEPHYGQQEIMLAQWQDAQYCFSLSRSPYRSDIKLVGVFKRLDDAAQSANIEAARLDDQEAPLRRAAKLATENEAERVRLEQARLVNKPKFRP
jgi:hypothetical protein